MTSAAGPSDGGRRRLAVLADTHLRAGGRGLPVGVLRVIDGCDGILHAGDILDAATLADLAELAPIWAVLGNNDVGLGDLPEHLVVELGGVRIGMVHDSGRTGGRPARLRRMFPDAGIVVFGHSHVPVDEIGADGQRLLNPGSPTLRRSQPTRTMAELVVADGVIVEHRIVDLGA